MHIFVAYSTEIPPPIDRRQCQHRRQV